MGKKAKRKKMGRPPMKDPRKIMVALRITPSEKRELTRAAKEAGMSLSAYLMAPHRRKRRRKG